MKVIERFAVICLPLVFQVVFQVVFHVGRAGSVNEDPCILSPCAHGGTCVTDTESSKGYTCYCTACYMGCNCTIPAQDLCNPNPCYGNAACELITKEDQQCGYICICPPGYLGSYCSEQVSSPATTTALDPTACPQNPCLNGATCTVHDGEIVCKCSQYASGRYCETLECKYTEEGVEYKGTLSVTMKNRVCQSWSATYPHTHPYTNAAFPDGSSVDAKNHCRNPDARYTGPWCYTTNPTVRWEPCKVPKCPDYTGGS